MKHTAGEYVRGDVHSNTVEGFFSILKRGIHGTFHHVSKGHLHRYCDEFAFRYSNRIALGVDDGERVKPSCAARRASALPTSSQQALARLNRLLLVKPWKPYRPRKGKEKPKAAPKRTLRLKSGRFRFRFDQGKAVFAGTITLSL